MGVYLVGMYFIGVYLVGVHLVGAYLMGVYLVGVCFVGMYLVSVYLAVVHLTGRASHGRIPRGVHLTRCVLHWACTSLGVCVSHKRGMSRDFQFRVFGGKALHPTVRGEVRRWLRSTAVFLAMASSRRCREKVFGIEKYSWMSDSYHGNLWRGG
jgi:hypothetical protein